MLTRAFIFKILYVLVQSSSIVKVYTINTALRTTTGSKETLNSIAILKNLKEFYKVHTLLTNSTYASSYLYTSYLSSNLIIIATSYRGIMFYP